MIEQDRLDVGQLEAERFDVLLGAIDGCLEARAHQDVSLRRGQEITLAVGGADEVEVAEDFERLRGCGGVLDLRAQLERRRDQLLSRFGVPSGEGRFGRLRRGAHGNRKDDERESGALHAAEYRAIHPRDWAWPKRGPWT